MENELLEALKGIERLCDNQNPSHENIWRIAHQAIQEAESKQTGTNTLVSGSVCELHEWKGGDDTNLCDCGKGDGTCKREQTDR